MTAGKYRPFRTNKGGFLPPKFDVAHDLCLLLHDLMAEILVSGEQSGIFYTQLEFKNNEDAIALENAEDLFAWLETTRQPDERALVLSKAVFPAVLSDTLHFLYEALESSRKGKLSVTYTLLRKPIQENFFLLEEIALDTRRFAEKLGDEPLKLRAQKIGNDIHARRIQNLLDVTKESHRFNSNYIAQLRYGKSEDGFDGICNLAVHLFTEHKAIRTEALNINFIFSDEEAKFSQWEYLYSRMPYLLSYMQTIVDYVADTFAKTDPEWINISNRRTAALTLLWGNNISSHYRTNALDKFIQETDTWLVNHCQKAGYRKPVHTDLALIARSGAYPGQSYAAIKFRNLRFIINSWLSRLQGMG